MIYLPLNAANLKLSWDPVVLWKSLNIIVGIIGRLFRVTDPPKISKRPSK